MEFDSQADGKVSKHVSRGWSSEGDILNCYGTLLFYCNPVLILVLHFRIFLYPMSWMAITIGCPANTAGWSQSYSTLDNGETVYLDENADGRQLQLAGKQIQIDSTTLNYSAADGQVVQSALVYNKVEVPQGGEYTLVLNDGTKVHLNSMSSLRFPLTFEAGKGSGIGGRSLF